MGLKAPSVIFVRSVVFCVKLRAMGGAAGAAWLSIERAVKKIDDNRLLG